MMFRKLYWVTESVDCDGSSRVTGVYTSIPHLIKNGFGQCVDLDCLRLSLTKLDCCNGSVAAWSRENFSRLEADLTHFVATEEFTPEHCKDLVAYLSPLAAHK
jgi:hypothetical protein